jgi:hypothetical protein
MSGQYDVATDGEGITLRALTLFDACNACRMVRDATVLCEGRLVAFWSSYHISIRPGFQAHPFERAEIATYSFVSSGGAR